MSVRKTYTCDLCNSSVTDANGVGIFHKATGEIEAVYLHKECAGHHLCNPCIRGLRVMIAGLDRLHQQHAELDRAEAAARPHQIQEAGA